MSGSIDYVAPISVDLGAINTGVYSAFYPARAKPEQIEKHGFVYTLKGLDYTLLMNSRTALRHQRRGYDRRQMAKRLFKLLWMSELKFEWNEEVSKVVGFLFNRRGFSFLTEGLDRSALASFPLELLQYLPDTLSQLVIETEKNVKSGSAQTISFLKTLDLLMEDSELLKELCSSFEHYSNSADKNSPWSFKTKSFKLDNAIFDITEDEKGKLKAHKSHLQHLSFALSLMHSELMSGAKYRKAYFADILAVLSNAEHKHKYLRTFCRYLHNGNYINRHSNKALGPESLANIIGHISNLELKPLRKYFRTNHSKEDRVDLWNPEHWVRIYKNWILNEWRVSENKNPDKKAGGEQDYAKLKTRVEQLEGNGASLIAFLSQEPAVRTIPPYQDNNNRRPPRCQSLILNTQYLNNAYPAWRKWLKILEELNEEYITGYRERLGLLTSSKGQPYFSGNFAGDLRTDSGKRSLEQLEARVLQFILDQKTSSDPLHLNQIYSQTKKLRQGKPQGENSQEVLGDYSRTLKDLLGILPKDLVSEPDFKKSEIFPPLSFLHFISKYYKMRNRAKDGRHFILPEFRQTKRRGLERLPRFTDSNQLIVLCNHKPRRKKYQTLSDVAAVLQCNVETLARLAGGREDEDIENWIKTFRGLPALCKDAAKAQKEHRGMLRIHLSEASQADKLTILKKKISKIGNELANVISSEEPERNQPPEYTVYAFSQLENLLFKDRSGNSSTCPVCSCDNSERMAPAMGVSRDAGAKAQRLPALPTRIIDGAVKRIFRILSKQIAKDVWNNIGTQLAKGKRVRVPLAIEMNRFHFEPDLASLKGKKAETMDPPDGFERKEARIEAAGYGVCPYTGANISGKGEIDHIIPRSSNWGTLNDEANLIYSSIQGNQGKLNSEYTLSDLHSAYKSNLFPGMSDQRIEQWIENALWNETESGLVFGRYISFINLSKDQQKAFRHSLFLPKANKLRTRVIQQIQNRSRSFVNGTQRYFAESLATEIARTALKQYPDKAHLLDFDFFGVDAFASDSGQSTEDYSKTYEKKIQSIKELRNQYEIYAHIDQAQKKSGLKQQPYSHLIDAIFAFMIAADKHRREGSFLLDIPTDMLPLPIDPEDSSYKDMLLAVGLGPKEFKIVKLARRKPHEGFTSHRAFTRATYYADHYLPLLFVTKQDFSIRVGYSLENSVEWEPKKAEWKYLAGYLQLSKQRKHFRGGEVPDFASNSDVKSWFESTPSLKRQVENDMVRISLDKRAFHDYLSENCNTKEGTTLDDFSWYVIKELGYRTEKRNLIDSSKYKQNLADIIPDVLDQTQELFTVNFKSQPIRLPIIEPWQELYNDTKKVDWNKQSFEAFIRKWFLKHRVQQAHNRARKEFSLPVKTTLGKFMIRRKGWDGNVTYQIVDDSDSRLQHNKAEIQVLANGAIGSRLARWSRGKSFVKLSSDNFTDGIVVDKETWYEIAKEDLPEYVSRLLYQLDNNTRPSITVTLISTVQKETILSNPLLKPRDEASVDDLLETPLGESFTYQLAGFPKAARLAVQKSISAAQHK